MFFLYNLKLYAAIILLVTTSTLMISLVEDTSTKINKKTSQLFLSSALSMFIFIL